MIVGRASLCKWPLVIMATLALAACGSVSTPSTPKQQADKTSPMANLALPTLAEADGKLVALYPKEMAIVAASGAAIDANGWLGRNRQYAQMISPRFQLGAGAALRIGLHQADLRMAQNGFRAIEAATAAIAPNGQVISIKPPDAPPRAELSVGDKASGAAFFLADACTGMLALRGSGKALQIADDAQQNAAEQALARAGKWLMAQADLLQRADKAAPNRLLYDALAFQSCGELAGDAAIKAMTARFVGLALAQMRDDGVFVEKGGSDTNYQAVAVRLSLDLLLTGYDGADKEALKLAWQKGAYWLGGRIMADGRIDSTGNTRTCSGGESFLGQRKAISPPDLFATLAYAGELIPNPDLQSAAQRLSAWAKANPRADACFP